MKNSSRTFVQSPHVSTILETPLGEVLLVANSTQALVGFYFMGQKYFPEVLPEKAPSLLLFTQVQRAIGEYVQGNKQAFSAIPISFSQGTPFQHRVWQGLRAVPHGTTLSYSQFAAQTGSPQGVRAVASAIGKNPLSLILPCHRIIGSNGALTGYAGGIALKKRLLEIEKVL